MRFTASITPVRESLLNQGLCKTTPLPLLLVTHQGEPCQLERAGLTSWKVMLQLPEVYSLKRMEQRQERQRSKRGFRRRKRTVGGKSIAWMRVLRPPEARKPDFPILVTLKQDGQVATCHPQGSCIQWSRRSQNLSPEGDNSPTLGP